ncbi:hypothetical protein OsI_39182 [Oryza sativa Indica Group]|uniref:SHSP domain-containing protein n=1 Tax=Oryza sativa subsp. indica TaxID=39946 RepID=B8BN43_ORYSI|nr:hypothetical protein OsI_39182 [Oryza sativa Indica Group]
MEQRRVYEEVEPEVEWSTGRRRSRTVLEIALPGFRKEQVRVQVDNHGMLRATGERPPAARGGRWVRFKKDLRLPDNCDADAVRARFDDHKLIITLPLVAAAVDVDESSATSPEFKTPPALSPVHAAAAASSYSYAR